jgi:hypothetical protein
VTVPKETCVLFAGALSVGATAGQAAVVKVVQDEVGGVGQAAPFALTRHSYVAPREISFEGGDQSVVGALTVPCGELALQAWPGVPK